MLPSAGFGSLSYNEAHQENDKTKLAAATAAFVVAIITLESGRGIFLLENKDIFCPGLGENPGGEFW